MVGLPVWHFGLGMTAYQCLSRFTYRNKNRRNNFTKITSPKKTVLSRTYPSNVRLYFNSWLENYNCVYREFVIDTNNMNNICSKSTDRDLNHYFLSDKPLLVLIYKIGAISSTQILKYFLLFFDQLKNVCLRVIDLEKLFSTNTYLTYGDMGLIF